MREDDLETLKVIPRRRFLEKQQLLKDVGPVPSVGQGPVPIETTETCGVDTWHTIPLVSPQETPSSSCFEWHMVGEEDAKDMVERDDSRQQQQPQLMAKKAEMLEVPHFTFDEGKNPIFTGHQKMSARPVFDKLRPEEGWKFLTMQFPGKVCLKDLIGRYKDGFLHDGRMYYYVSSSSLDVFSFTFAVFGTPGN